MKGLMYMMLAMAMAAPKPGHDVCRPAPDCKVDGSGCVGEKVIFSPWNMTISKWDQATKSYTQTGILSSHARAGEADTWKMYMHGPLLRPSERTDPLAVPPTYMQATWTNKVYRFEDMGIPVLGQDLEVTQKMVGYSLAPSTSYPIEDPTTGKLKGLLLAEGQPFFASDSNGTTELYKGGVEFLPVDGNCTQIFPSLMDGGIEMVETGEVVNTVDCHETGICFFTVWKFYDDAEPIWNNHSAPDCLHWCLLRDLHDPSLGCKHGGVVADENGEKICHKEGVGAVHGMTIGHTDKDDPNTFDIFLVFTGKATFDKGESSMKKLKVTKTSLGLLSVIKSEAFATQLFVDSVTPPHDAGGDHAWPDDSGKYLWISTFRVTSVGIHMVDYFTGDLIYSVKGVDTFVEGSYAYSAGLHGVGSLGVPGSYIGVATSGCKFVDTCGPVPFPAPGSAFIIDISTIW